MQNTQHWDLPLVLVLLTILLAPIRARAVEYHLAATGDDANAGTAEAPFRTLRKGISVLKPGDTLYVKNGTYKGVIEYGAFRSGTSWDQPVTVAAHPGHRPVIVPPGDGEACLYIVATEYFVLDGFVLDSAPNGQGVGITWGTGFPQAHHIELRNCEIKNSRGQGIGTAGDGCRFVNLDVHDNGTDGFTHGIYLNGDGNLIDGGKWYRNVGWGIHVYPKATNTTVRNIRCFENGATGLGLVWGSNNVAYNNIVYRNGSGIHLSGDSPRCYNNTVFGNRGEGLSVANAENGSHGTRKADVRNNIVFQNGDGIRDYATGSGTILSNNVTDDPGFVDAPGGDFRLRDGSPAIDKGADLRGQGVTADIEGTPRPQGDAFDIGAYEFAPRKAAHGPLRVHPENSRYFTDGARAPDGSFKAIYLTGSHTWNSLVDMGRSDPPEKFDFAVYIDFLERHHHNFVRLWAWDSTTWDTRANGALGKDFVHHAAPLPWVRTGPGNALDGKPRFDLTKFDPEYFERLRSRVTTAAERGIYVSVMLFEGWGLMHGNRRPGTEDGWAWRSHPFNPANNINGLEIEAADTLTGRVHTLRNPEANKLQAAYIRKVVDTLNGLDNVLYEVINEGGEKEWNWWVITTTQEYERAKAKQHPVGNTGHGAERLASMLASPADWISPGRVDGFAEDPPAWNEKRVSLLDTDHIWGVGGSAAWVWKAFLRGHNPIFMDPYDGSVLGDDRRWEPLRAALGHTGRLAERLNLARMTPRNDLASTGYCLANPGTEYLIYQPKSGEALSVKLEPGIYHFEWFIPAKGERGESGNVKASGGPQLFKAPFESDAVLWLRRASETERSAGLSGQ